MKRFLSPVAVAAVLAMIATLAMVFYLTLTVGDLSQGGSQALAIGPLTFLSVGRVVSAQGSEASINPGLGLVVLWVAFIAWGLTVGARRLAHHGAPAHAG